MKNIIKEIKIPFFCFLTLFAVTTWLGYFSGQSHPKDAAILFDKFFQNFSSLKKINVFAMFFFIFVNNSIKTFAMFTLGSFYGIVPILFVAINGALIGTMSSVIVAKHGVGYLFAGIIPHGVLEIPAMIIAASYGWQLGKKFYRKSRYGEPFKPFFFRMSGKMFRYVIPLLAVASFVETFITMTILRSI